MRTSTKPERVLERERERERETTKFSKEVWNPNPIVFVFGANPKNLLLTIRYYEEVPAAVFFLGFF
jgi:hypothetical protein